MEHKPHECSQTWQVLRSEFDKMMLDNAREHGVEVHEGVRVLEVLFEGERAVGVRVQDEDGTRARSARQGRRRRQRAELDDRQPLQAARWRSGAEERGACGPTWKAPIATPGATKGPRWSCRRQGKKGWFWYIPLHNNIVSVGVVAAFDYLFEPTAAITRRSTTKSSTAARL